MVILEIVFWAFVILVAYVYAGYPLILKVISLFRPPREPGNAGDPSVTLVISAFNERDVIAAKLENSLEIDYPRDRLEIMVVSDASDDGTDEIVEGFEGRGITLLRMPERGGKTLGLNAAAKAAHGDLLVFSDANAMYRPDAIRALVRNFSDPQIGAAVGESTYSDSANDAERSESAYWRYETAIKRLESRIGSVVGGDGAIYAIRRELYRPMAADALSDFVNPLQIVKRGKRCVYEPDAVSVEEAAGSFVKEFRRKVRIVNRAWRATMSMKGLMNPFGHGLFAWMLISHKLMRWLVPAFLTTLLLVNFALIDQHPIYRIALWTQVAFYGAALTGALLRRYVELPIFLYVPYYFCLVNLASAKGILEAFKGKKYTTWSTARADS